MADDLESRCADLALANAWLREANATQAAEIERLRAAHTPTKTRLEFNKDGSLDEIVAFDAFIHLEQMDSNRYWMRVSANGTDHIVWFSARGKITASHEDEPTYVPEPPK